MNTVALTTLFLKEIRRFMKVWLQTVLAPLMTTSLYFLVFGVALGSRLKTIDGITYIQYVVPGLVMLSLIRESFLNTASSLFQSKINGTITDVLVAPIGALEMLIAYVGAAVVRASIVASLVLVVALFFTPFTVAHPWWALYFALTVSASFAMLGLATALWAQKFDHLTVFPNFVLTPLTFLGGVFYSIKMLPTPWDTISSANPLLYMVNGLRYGFLNVSDMPVATSALVCLLVLVFSAAISTTLFVRGYRLRA